MWNDRKIAPHGLIHHRIPNSQSNSKTTLIAKPYSIISYNTLKRRKQMPTTRQDYMKASSTALRSNRTSSPKSKAKTRLSLFWKFDLPTKHVRKSKAPPGEAYRFTLQSASTRSQKHETDPSHRVIPTQQRSKVDKPYNS